MTTQDPTTDARFLDLVVGLVAAALGTDPADVDPHADLTGLGLGSVQVLALLGDVEDEAGVDVDPEAVVDHPTPAALAAHLASLVDARAGAGA
ncbi:acyl carrier protein [Cellulosimicrobium marinum]|uniref:acyl carrier protein n=1 Tax=Cellulosimicrobium marinum TaxID=1638992 RepID=UPI001E4F42EE|nr:acyl carrier protein [Cellulosimicrobium marinum]MCB7135517.1 acyl carrier protein [Cellulosimicrobium marinum]